MTQNIHDYRFLMADVLVMHTRLSDEGKCFCGDVVPLGKSFAMHQADAQVDVIMRIDNTYGDDDD